MVLGLKLKIGEFFRATTSSVGVSGIIPCTGSGTLLVLTVEDGRCCGVSPTGAHHIPKLSQGGHLAEEVVAGGGELKTRFTTKPELVVWQAAAMASNICAVLMSHAYAVGWFGYTVLTILMSAGGC